MDKREIQLGLANLHPHSIQILLMNENKSFLTELSYR